MKLIFAKIINIIVVFIVLWLLNSQHIVVLYDEILKQRYHDCHNITMYLYQIIVELLMQWLISKVLYRQSLHTNLLSFLVVSLHQYKTLTLKLHQIAVVM